MDKKHQLEKEYENNRVILAEKNAAVVECKTKEDLVKKEDEKFRNELVYLIFDSKN